MVVIVVTNGFAVFFPGHFDVADFLTAYISFPIFAILYIGHRIWQRGGPWLKPIEEIDMFSGLEEVEEVTANDVKPVPRNFLERFWYWLC